MPRHSRSSTPAAPQQCGDVIHSQIPSHCDALSFMQTQAASASQSRQALSLITEREFLVPVSREFTQFCISVNTQGPRKRSKSGETGYSCHPFSCLYQVISRDLVTRYRLLCRPDNDNSHRVIALVPGGDGLNHTQMINILRSAVLQLNFDCGHCGIAPLDESKVSVKSLPLPAERGEVILAVRQSLGITLRANDWLQFARADGFVSSDITEETRDTVSREHVSDVFRLAVDFHDEACFVRIKPSQIRTFGVDETKGRSGVGTMVNVLPKMTPAKLVAVSTPSDKERECLRVFWLNKYGFRLPERFLVADVCFRHIKKPLAYPMCCLVTHPGEVNCGLEQAQAIGAEVVDILKSMQLFDPDSRVFAQLFEDLSALSNASASDGDSDRSSVVSTLSQDSAPTHAYASPAINRGLRTPAHMMSISSTSSVSRPSHDVTPQKLSFGSTSMTKCALSSGPQAHNQGFVLTSGFNISKNPQLMTAAGAMCAATKPVTQKSRVERPTFFQKTSASESLGPSAVNNAPKGATQTSGSSLRKNPSLATAPPQRMCLIPHTVSKTPAAPGKPVLTSDTSKSGSGAFVLTSGFNISKNPSLTHTSPLSMLLKQNTSSKAEKQSISETASGVANDCSKANSGAFVLTSGFNISKNPSLMQGPPADMSLLSGNASSKTRKPPAKNLLCAPGASKNLVCAPKGSTKQTPIALSNASSQNTQTSVSKPSHSSGQHPKPLHEPPRAKRARTPANPTSAPSQTGASKSSFATKARKPRGANHSNGPLSSLSLNQPHNAVPKPVSSNISRITTNKALAAFRSQHGQNRKTRLRTPASNTDMAKKQKVQHAPNASNTSNASRYLLPNKKPQHPNMNSARQSNSNHNANLARAQTHPTKHFNARSSNSNSRFQVAQTAPRARVPGLPTSAGGSAHAPSSFPRGMLQTPQFDGNLRASGATKVVKITYSENTNRAQQSAQPVNPVSSGANPISFISNEESEQDLETVFAARKISKKCLAICLEQEVDVSVLMETTVDEMKELGFAFGDRKKILRWQREIGGG